MTELEQLNQERVIIEKVLTRLNIVMNDLASEPAVRELVTFQFGDKLLKNLINSIDNYDVLNFHIPTDDEESEFYIKACEDGK